MLQILMPHRLTRALTQIVVLDKKFKESISLIRT